MTKRSWPVCIPLFALVGFILVCLGFDNHLWERRHMPVIESQLAGLKELLLDYRKTHGRYPTNDEGLAVLDNFDWRVTFESGRGNLGWPDGESNGGSVSFWPPYWWQGHYRDQLQWGRGESPGDSPGNRARIGSNLRLLFADRQPTTRGAPVDVELGVTRSNECFLLSSVGPLTPWFTPYTYENRNGCDPKAFSFSPADDDPHRRYSVQVDEGIYVYSVGGRMYADRAFEPWWKTYWAQILGLGCIGAGLALTVVLACRRGWKPGLRGLASWIGVLLGGVVIGVSVPSRYTTCYLPASSIFSDRNPEMIPRQMDLLNKYRDANVINRETYEKTKAFLENGPATRPASQPRPR